MSIWIRYLTLFALLLLLAGCFGGSSDSIDRPVARASASQTEVSAGEEEVTLDGSESSSPNGDIQSWQWGFLRRPENSEAELSGADSPTASFTPDEPGEYVLRLVVNDGSAESEDSEASRVTVTATNPNPVAVTQDEISWIVGTVQLDGSRSKPPHGGRQSQLVYNWTLTEKPEGSSAELDSGNLAYPRFTADSTGLYRAELVVEYGDRQSEPATTDIHIRDANAEPVAKIAEIEEAVMLGDTVNLDGSVSKDADGDPLQYRWRLLRTPNGSSAELSSTTTPQTSFVADSRSGEASYRIQLCVFDGIARNCTAMTLTPELPEDAANTSPVARITPGSNFTHELERGAEATIRGGDSYDIDGDALSYEWEIISHPEGFDPEANGPQELPICDTLPSICRTTAFTPTEDGDYVMQLTVSDGQQTDTTTATFTAMLGANRPPRAVAETTTGNPTTMVGQQVTLDGEGSRDPDDNRLSYDWKLIQKPDDSQTQLQEADTATPTLVPDQPGPYIARLVVTDEHGATSRYAPGNGNHEVVVLAKASNNPPVTRLRTENIDTKRHVPFSTEQPFAITGNTETSDRGRVYRLDAFRLNADSYDPDGDLLNHLWTLVDEPDGNQMELNGYDCDNGTVYTVNNEMTWEEYRERVEGYREWNCKEVPLSPTKAGTYVFQYQVTDGSEFAGPYTATVHAVQRENYPSLLIESPKYSHLDSQDYYKQVFFPYLNSKSVHVHHWMGSSASETVDVGDASNVKLTAFGGDYTIEGIKRHSDDPDHMPYLVKASTDQRLENGYVIKQGESLTVSLRVPFGLSRSEYSYDEAETKMEDASIRASFRIKEKDGWKVTMEPDF